MLSYDVVCHILSFSNDPVLFWQVYYINRGLCEFIENEGYFGGRFKKFKILSGIIKGCKKFIFDVFIDCSLIGKRDIAEILLEKVPNVEILRVKGLEESSALGGVKKRVKKLEILDCSELNVNFGEFSNLTKVTIDNSHLSCDVQEVNLAEIFQLERLQKVCLVNVLISGSRKKKVSDTLHTLTIGFTIFPGWILDCIPNVESLFLVKANLVFSEEDCKSINERLPRLELVEIDRCFNVSESLTKSLSANPAIKFRFRHRMLRGGECFHFNQVFFEYENSTLKKHGGSVAKYGYSKDYVYHCEPNEFPSNKGEKFNRDEASKNLNEIFNPVFTEVFDFSKFFNVSFENVFDYDVDRKTKYEYVLENPLTKTSSETIPKKINEDDSNGKRRGNTREKKCNIQ